MRFIAGQARESWRGAALALLLLIAVASPQHYRNDVRTANEAARIYAAQAIVEHGTVALDPVFDREFPGWRARARPPNVNVARRGDRYVSDKAPGVTMLAVPVLAALRWAGVELGYPALAWLLTLLLSAAPAVGFACWSRRWLRQSFGTESAAPLVAPALLVASPWLVYGGLLFSHSLAAALFGAGALVAVGPLSACAAEPPRTRRDGIAGGLLLGMAVLVEYTAGLGVALVCAALVIDPARRGRLVWVVLGGLGPALALGVHNAIVFGHPLELGYAHKANAAFARTHATGVYGIGAPDASRLYGMLLSARRGLLFLAPWLAGAVVGAVLVARDRGVARAWRVLLVAGIAAVPVVLSGFGDWHGGRAVGPRYVLFALPLFGVGTAAALHRLGAGARPAYLYAVAGGLAVSSLMICALGAYVFPYPSEALVNPLFEVNAPVLLNGGPARTMWPSGLGDTGAALGVAAALASLIAPALLVVARAQRRSARPLVLPIAVALAVAFAHLAAATVPHSAASERARILRERAFTHQLLGQPAAARRARAALPP